VQLQGHDKSTHKAFSVEKEQLYQGDEQCLIGRFSTNGDDLSLSNLVFH
jgi:hypothetical protein